jgi:hypothetical protein
MERARVVSLHTMLLCFMLVSGVSGFAQPARNPIRKCSFSIVWRSTADTPAFPWPTENGEPLRTSSTAGDPLSFTFPDSGTGIDLVVK